MAASSTSAAAETASEVNVADFVSEKLQNSKNYKSWIVSEKLQNSKNYKSWREQMLRFMESQGLAGPPPPPPTMMQDDTAWLGGRRQTADDFRFKSRGFFAELPTPRPTVEQEAAAAAAWSAHRAAYLAWRDTDDPIRFRLLESVSDEVAETLANYESAYDMWRHLEKNFSHYSKVQEYLPLYKAAMTGDWEMAKAILEHDPGAVDARVTFSLETALHVAVSSGKSASFVARLVERMSDEALAIADRIGFNALHTAALTGNLPTAKILTHRLPALLYKPCKAGRFPVHWAAVWAADVAHRQTFEFLIYEQTRDVTWNNPSDSHNGLLLLSYMIDADDFDMALDLVDKYPDLARFKSKDHGSALMMIATKDTAFSIDAHFNWWERLIYNSLPQQQLPTLCNLIKRLVPRVKGIHEKKLKRDLALKLVKSLCKHMESLSHEEAEDIYEVPFLAAARLGIHEIIEEVVDKFPTAIYSTDRATEQNFIHLAVQNRCERVFNLMYQTGNHRYQYANRSDSSGNTILHLAAALAPPHKLNLVSGAALQMQREIQWFKEAEKFISPYYREGQNNAKETPKIIFTEKHRMLKVEGEKWMKDTANSCTIAAALIVTIVFAAAITVPGGNDSNSGFPMMWKSSAFTIFAVSDAISLFTSTTSLLMFLSILTSRYAEEDFLYALPKRLCIGLVTLFLSILFMMVAFGSTLYLVFGRMHTWILVPVVALSLLPISSFVLLQFPLLIDVVSSTYGRGIFGKQS